MRVKLVLMTSTLIILSILLALLPSAIRRVQPTAEFVLLVVSPGLWNSVSTWITAPCWYVLLNVVIVTLGFISRGRPTSNDYQPYDSSIIRDETEVVETNPSVVDPNHSDIIVQSKLSDAVEIDFSPAASRSPDQLHKQAGALVMECRSRSFKDLKTTLTPAPALYAKKSRLIRSITKLSKESRDNREMTIAESCTPAAPKTSLLPPQLVVFETSGDMGNQAHLNDEVAKVEGDEESHILHGEEDGMALSAEELYVKAESFIGDFYRQLKMQREDSLNRLCGISSA